MPKDVSDVTRCLICGASDWRDLQHVERNGVVFELALCSSCGFVAQVPPLTEAAIGAYYRADYNRRNYGAELPALHETMKEPGRLRVAFLERHGALASARRALEIGPGTGSFMALLAERSIAVEGVDADPQAAAWMREAAGLTIHDGLFDDVFDRHAATWRMAPFDLVAMIHLFEHLSNPAATLARIATILAPGGRIFIEVPNLLRPFSDQRDWEHYCDPGHLSYFSLNTLPVVLRRAGMTIEAITDDTMRPYRNIQCLCRPGGAAAVAPNLPCDDPRAVEAVWRGFVRGHARRWYLGYGWKADVKRALSALGIRAGRAVH
jgi:2-polyprenyl-3-methyl-5-hydroxy-6-metoxy-1,4-benzoquinol methylase